ncbi:MAG: hypothetical protein U5J62_03215 [Desulfurivibrio sp.]|nr:hypothetical protein [Desulfurivibrio sp.]
MAAEKVGGAEETVTLNFKDAEIKSVVDSVARITGKTFVIDPAVKGEVTIVSSKPLPPDEVYAVFLSILQVHDFAAVEAGEVTKIIPAAKANQDLVVSCRPGKKPGLARGPHRYPDLQAAESASRQIGTDPAALAG